MFVSKLVIWLLLALCSTCNARDHLKAGDEFNSSNSLCSQHGSYCFCFDYNDLIVLFKTDFESFVWYPLRNESLNTSTKYSLTLDHSGVLKITRQNKEPVILYSPPHSESDDDDEAMTLNNTVATLYENGNFVLQQLLPNGSKSNDVLWQSFDHPSDTFMSGMRLGFDNKSGKIWSIVSDYDLYSAAPGRFTLEWDILIQQLIIRKRGEVYWASGELKNGKFEKIPEDVQSFYNYTVISNKDEGYFTFTTQHDEYSTWSLMYNGQLRTGQPGEFFIIASGSQCYGYNNNGGCKLRDQPICRQESGQFFESMDVRVPEQVMSFDVDDNGALNTSDCKTACWNNCDCVGFTTFYINGTGCSFYYEHLRAQDISRGLLTINYLTTRGQYPRTKTNARRNKIKRLIAVIITAPSLTLALIIWRLLKRRKLKCVVEDKKIAGMENITLVLETSSGSENAINELPNYKRKKHDLRLLCYAYIMEATENFSPKNKLGEGGFGSVYKGKLHTGIEVAIKRLSRSSRQGIMEFQNELRLISELQHMNLVQLLGCCVHEEERILIYEYMPNKSLDFFLFDSTRSNLLDWNKRFNIIEGIAQGLIYLHKYSRLKVVHRDLKPSNILLDENMNPKISDFGLARIITEESERSTSKIVGTYGYMPPESSYGVFSMKSDVYSFGILLLEIVSGRRNNSFQNADHALNIVGHVWELFKEGMELELVDPVIKDSIIEDQVLRCIHIGLLCVEERVNDRPTMAEISLMLSNESAKLPSHKRPAFCFVNESLSRSCNDSANGLTISDLFAR